jgi:hypothetical protein
MSGTLASVPSGKSWIFADKINTDIQAVPLLKSPLSHFHPKFLKQSSEALRMCNNISSFTCVCPILPPLLLSLQEKSRLQEIRIHARLTADQAAKLTRLGGLRSITLDHASWNVVDTLPKWSGANRTTLKSLTLYVSIMTVANQNLTDSQALLVSSRSERNYS